MKTVEPGLYPGLYSGIIPQVTYTMKTVEPGLYSGIIPQTTYTYTVETVEPGFFTGVILPKTNGTTTQTIKLGDFGIKNIGNHRVNTNVRLKVRRGTARLELLDSKGQPTASIASIPGKRALGKGYLVTDASGALKLRITASEAENIEYKIEAENIQYNFTIENK